MRDITVMKRATSPYWLYLDKPFVLNSYPMSAALESSETLEPL